MQTLQQLDARAVVAVFTSYRDLLELHRERINRLNVFPVPDGDTGTNMALTLGSVVEALTGKETMTEVADAVSLGSLMGARGNSGVILSQILRGLSEGIKGAGNVGPAELSDGFSRAADGAYKAVENPLEGTILSVIKAIAEGAHQALSEVAPSQPPATLELMLRAARDSGIRALEATPGQLPQLAAAGVVDSGGTGLMLLLDAMLHVAAGEPLPEVPETPQVAGVALSGSPGHDEGEGSCRYEVMYLLEAPDEAIPAFRSVWAGIGESIVVVGGDGIYNCHIHTDDVGAAIEASLDAGRPRRIRVSDLFDEVEEERWVREASSQSAAPAGSGEERVTTAVVAVCSGHGISRIFHSLGVQRIVAGGQSMNPSTAELLEAIEGSPSDEVVILPNNSNIIAVAEAAAARATKPTVVVSTRNVPEGFAALIDYDPEARAEDNLKGMAAGVKHVVAGEVTHAVRDSSSEAGQIVTGDWLGISAGEITSISKRLSDAAEQLLDHLIDRNHHEILTIIAGEDSTPADTRRITEWLEERHPEMAYEVHQGAQPVYPYLFGID